MILDRYRYRRPDAHRDGDDESKGLLAQMQKFDDAKNDTFREKGVHLLHEAFDMTALHDVYRSSWMGHNNRLKKVFDVVGRNDVSHPDIVFIWMAKLSQTQPSSLLKMQLYRY